MASLKTWLSDLRDLLSSRFCAVCGRRLGTTERKVCAACLVDLPYTEIEDFYDNAISRLFWGKIPIARAHCYIRYRHDSDSHRLLMKLKYLHRPDLGRWMGQTMARDLLPKGFFEDVEALMYVPLHWQRQWSRGYNQSRLVAFGIAEVTGLPVLKGAVWRLRNNESQTSKSSEERQKNVRDLFQAKPGIPFRHVLLIDDVLTTGATLSSCAEAISRQNPDMCFSILTWAKA